MTKTILGIFAERADVEDAIGKLQAEGFNPKDISIVMKDKREQEEIGDDTGANVAGGALSGATTGAVVGGVAGFLAGTVMPALGGFLIGGPIGAALGLTGAAATTVSGAATGAVAGGLIGALMGLGLTRDDAKHYEQRVNEGAILLAVPAGNAEESTVVQIFDEYHASDVKTIAQTHEDRGDYASNQDEDYPKSSYADTNQQFAVMGAKGGRTAGDSDQSGDDQGWHGEPKRHAKAAEKGHATHSRSHKASHAKGGRSSKTSGRGWHGDDKHHAQARKGKEPHK